VGYKLVKGDSHPTMVLAFYLTLLALHARPGGDAPLWHDEIIELKPTDSVLFFYIYIETGGRAPTVLLLKLKVEKEYKTEQKLQVL
jgi:hypothetical protein